MYVAQGATEVGVRWRAVRGAAGYTAAGTMSLYLFVKIVWIVAALFGRGPERVGAAGGIGLNAVTVVMAAVGVGLGLALASGRRLPARPVVLFAWTGSGFLVALIPFMLVSAVLSAAGAAQDSGGASSPPSWETAFISVGFAGMALGLTVGLPIYLLERWPHAFEGRLGDGTPRPSAFARPAMAASAALGILWLYWAAGGTLGLARDGDLTGRLLYGSAGLWALVACWSVHALNTRGPARLPLWAPMTLAFTASGSLFAWNCWKLPLFLLRPDGYIPAERPAVAVVQYAVAILTGLAALRIAYERSQGSRWARRVRRPSA